MEYFGPRRVRPGGPSRPRIRLGPRKAAHRPTTEVLSVYPAEAKGDGAGRGEPVVDSHRKSQRRTPAVLPAVIWVGFGLHPPRHGNTSTTQMLYLFLKISTHFKQSQYHRRPLGAEQQACGFYNNLDPLLPPMPSPGLRLAPSAAALQDIPTGGMGFLSSKPMRPKTPSSPINI